MNSDKYVNIIRLLRVLNAVRESKIGIPLTFTQYPFCTEVMGLLVVQFFPQHCQTATLEPEGPVGSPHY
jgi:hypothetical protein